jgi:diacylglycerol kinase (ATP)
MVYSSSSRYPMRVTLVHNPDAGDQSHSAKRILKELSGAGYDAHLASSGKKGVGKALEDPGDLVVVAGGDGSIKKVAFALVGRGIPMAILPIGTANNIAKSLGIIGSVGELIAGWSYTKRQRLAIGTVSALYGTMQFVESVGVGAFTELIARGHEEIHENPSGLTGHSIDRALLLLRSIVQERGPSSRRLGIDGADLSGEYLLVEAMNTSLVGPNVPLAPDADFADDRLDVVTVTEAERAVLAEYLEARLAGGADPPRLTVQRGKRVTMGASPQELHVDDDLWEADLPAEAGGSQQGLEEAEVTIAVREAVDVLAAEA